MGMRSTQLACKEVVCVSDGSRLGFVADLIVDECDGCVRAIVVPGRGKLGCSFGCNEEYVIPWSSICRIGDDIILVDIAPADCCKARQKPKWFR